ncbi:MAG: hypothetical protein FWG68_04430 [Defluviitaleaceae bacterium]|nr:hypothetical protein [Defluviitaleaceae bacterium]
MNCGKMYANVAKCTNIAKCTQTQQTGVMVGDKRATDPPTDGQGTVAPTCPLGRRAKCPSQI